MELAANILGVVMVVLCVGVIVWMPLHAKRSDHYEARVLREIDEDIRSIAEIEEWRRQTNERGE